MKGVNSSRYEDDLDECRLYAEQVSPTREAMVGGGLAAAVGATIGAIAGAFGGSAGTGAATGAAIGGVSGTAAGGAGGVSQQQQVIDRCLIGRGYKVLS
jgi:outer membrane lipoprotein SlyB